VMMTGLLLAAGCALFAILGVVGVLTRRPMEKLAERMIGLDDRWDRR
jgi:hypothetical protein